MHYRLHPIRLAVVLAFIASSCLAQSLEEKVASLRERGSQILNLREQVRAGRGVPRSFDRRAAVDAIQERAQALLDLMRESPEEAIKLALPEEGLEQLRQSFPEGAPWLERFGEWSGDLEVTVFDDFETESAETEVLLRLDGEEKILHFPGDIAPALECTQEVKVEGLMLGGEMAVRAAAATADRTASACTPSGSQSTLVILAKFPGYADKFTPAHARNLIFGSGSVRSLNTFWRETSAGRTSAVGSVVGWITLDRLYTCTEYSTMRSAAVRAADSLVDLTQFTRILIFFPKPGSCSFGGVSTVGCTSISTRRGSSLASLSMMVADYATTVNQGVQISSHEAGHGLGLSHAASRDFGTMPLGALGTAGTVSTYGDKFNTMGYWNLGHYTASQKRALGWWSYGAQVSTIENSGTYTIAPAELAGTGVQALKVRRGTGKNAWLWLEYRRPVGLFDTALPSQVFTGVLIHYEDSFTGALTHLLDFSPGSANWNGPTLAAGATWVDPYTNIRLTVLSANSLAATVSISYGVTP